MLAALSVLTFSLVSGTAAPAVDQTAPAPPRAYDEGFVLAAPDGSFQLRTRALLQVQYLGSFRQGDSLATESGILLRRARLGWDGFVYSPKLGFKVELDFGQQRALPLEAYLEGRFQHVSVRAGQTKVPFSRNWMLPDAFTIFAARSVATDEFRYDYDLGVVIATSWLEGRLLALAGGFNGAGAALGRNDNIDPVLVARVAGTPLGPVERPEEGDLERTPSPSLTLGGSASLDYVPPGNAYGFTSGSPVAARPIVAVDTDGDGRPDGVRVTQLEADLTFKWRGIALEAEVYFRKESWGSIGQDQPGTTFQFIPRETFSGYFVQASSFLLSRRLLLGLRWSSTELSPLTIGGRVRPPSTCVAGDGAAFSCSLPFSEQLSELTVLAAHHRFGHGLQLAAQYSLFLWSTSEVAPLPYDQEHRAILQAKLAF
jgi:hypothetical protein